MLKITDYALPSPDQWRMAIKGMRNAYKSWDKSDSYITLGVFDYIDDDYFNLNYKSINRKPNRNDYLSELSYSSVTSFYLGKADANLLKKLTERGSEHRKVIRDLKVQLEIKAPLKWWDQMDQYKVGTTTSSTSQMHTLLKEAFRPDMFDGYVDDLEYFNTLCDELNILREDYFKLKDDSKKKKLWNKILNRIPQSFIYTRVWGGSLENLINIYFQRRNHKLDNWHIFCNWLFENIPYFRELVEVIEQSKPNFNQGEKKTLLELLETQLNVIESEEYLKDILESIKFRKQNKKDE